MNNTEQDLLTLDKSQLSDIVQQVLSNRKPSPDVILEQLKDEIKHWVEVEKMTWKEITEVLEKAYNICINGQKLSKFYKFKIKGFE